jgi:hypothetical protein
MLAGISAFSKTKKLMLKIWPHLLEKVTFRRVNNVTRK